MTLINLRKSLRALFLCTMFGLLSLSAFSQDSELFYYPSTKDQVRLSADQQQIHQLWEQDPSVADWFFAYGEPAMLMLDRDQIRLPLFDRDIFLKKQHAETDILGNWNWSGDVLDIKGKVIGETVLVVNPEGEITGTIFTENDMYGVRHLGEGLYAIALLIEEAEANDEDLISQVNQFVNNGEQTEDGAGKTTIIIDLMVAYTQQALSKQPNLLSYISQNVTQGNNILRNNDIDATFNLVHVYKTSYSTSNFALTDRDRFIAKNDGYMDEVHGLRDTKGADICLLYSGFSDYAGIAGAIGASESSAFAALSADSASAISNYTFTHEIGHLLGCSHNPESAGGAAPYPYGHGYRHGNSHRTVMAYNCSGGCKRVAYFSTPHKNYNGKSLGDTTTFDNDRVIRENMNRISGFREHQLILKTPTLRIESECIGRTFLDWTTQNEPGISYQIYKEVYGRKTLIATVTGHDYAYYVSRFDPPTYFLVRACSGGTCSSYSNKVLSGTGPSCF